MIGDEPTVTLTADQVAAIALGAITGVLRDPRATDDDEVGLAPDQVRGLEILLREHAVWSIERVLAGVRVAIEEEIASLKSLKAVRS